MFGHDYYHIFDQTMYTSGIQFPKKPQALSNYCFLWQLGKPSKKNTDILRFMIINELKHILPNKIDLI